MSTTFIALIFMVFGKPFLSEGQQYDIFLPDKSMSDYLIDAEGEPYLTDITLEQCCAYCMPLSCSAIFYHPSTGRCLQRRNVDLGYFSYASDWKYFTRVVPTIDFSVDQRYKIITYVPSSTPDVYVYAVNECSQDGSRLLRIHSSYQHSIVIQHLEWFYKTTGTLIDVDTYIVIDGSLGTDNIWYHSDGSEVKYLNWMYNQPNNLNWQTNGNQTTLTFYSTGTHGMNDMWNRNNIYPYTNWIMCEYKF